jgi:hypothetical protein
MMWPIKSGLFFVACLLASQTSLANAYGTDGCNDSIKRPLVDFELGEALKTLEPVRLSLFNQTDPEGYPWITGGLVDVTITHRDKAMSFPSVGGMSSTVLLVNSAYQNPVMTGISFYYQCRGLTQKEVIDRAKATVANFRKVGFNSDKNAKFLFQNAYGSTELRNLKNWKGLDRAMRDRPGDLGVIGVAALVDRDVELNLFIHNMGQKTGGGKTIFDDDTGRQYLLQISYHSRKLELGEFSSAE